MPCRCTRRDRDTQSQVCQDTPVPLALAPPRRPPRAARMDFRDACCSRNSPDPQRSRHAMSPRSPPADAPRPSHPLLSHAVDGDTVERHDGVFCGVQRPLGYVAHEGEPHRSGVRRKDERLQRPRLIACNAAASGCESKVEFVLGVTIGRDWGLLRWIVRTTTTCTLPLATWHR